MKKKKQVRRAGVRRANATVRATAPAVKAACKALVRAIDSVCATTGEMQWTNGYRTRFESQVHYAREATRLYEKELAQSRLCEAASRKADLCIAALIRAVRRERRS